MMRAHQFGEKLAIAVEQGGIASRAMASTLGHVGAFPLMTILSPRSHVNPSQWRGATGSLLDREISPDDERAQRHKQLAEDMTKTNPQELKDTMVYLGAPNLFREYARLYKNPRSSVLGKLYAGLTLPLTVGMVNLSRGSAYHPMTDSVYHMGDKPSVLTHELGHALDFNSAPVPEHKPGASKLKTWLKRQGAATARDLYAFARALPVAGGMLALPQETLANSLSLENLKKTYADQPEKLEKLLEERQKVLPAGYGSYLGGALAAPLGPFASLAAPAFASAGLLGGKIYGLIQNRRRKGKYVAQERAKDDANADGTADVLEFVRREQERKQEQANQSRQKAAYAFGVKLADMASAFDQYNDAFKDMYGTDIRLPHGHNALRSLLIAATVGGGLGLGRGAIWPGYIEKKDKKGRIVAKTKRSPLLGAAEGAALGAGASVLSNYASQVMSQYNPEIDRIIANLPNAPSLFRPVGGG